MKIAIFTDTYLPEFNGIVTSIKNFSERMAERGHKVYIFCPKYDKHRLPKAENITVIRFPSFSFATNKNTKIAFPSLIRIFSEIRKVRPDVIHIQTPMNIGVTGLMVSKIFDIPNIQTYHTYLPDFMVYLNPKTVLGIDQFYEQVKSSKVMRNIVASRTFRELKAINDESLDVGEALKKVLKVRGRVKRVAMSERFAWDFTRFLYGRADLVLAPSNALVEMLKEHGLKNDVEFQSNGIEYNYFLKKKNYHIHERIVHVGRLGLEKDVDVIVKAMKELVPSHPNLTLDIIGDGPALDSLKKLTTKLKLEKNINFLGYVARSDLRTKLRSYDFFVTASAMETQGLVILEAMSAGLPIIGVKKLAVPEIVINDKTGYVAKPKNPHSFAEKTALLLKSRKKNELLGENAKEMALSHHIYGEVEKLENYYMETVFRHHNRTMK